MIHVDRSSTPPPAALEAAKGDLPDTGRGFGKDAGAALLGTAAVLGGVAGVAAKMAVDAGVSVAGMVRREREVGEALRDVFQGKCAFCESALDQASVVHRFRPASDAIDLDGAVSAEHYGWLKLEWDNLYPACATCAQRKGTRFPVGADRATPGTTGDALRAERPLLVDPCSPHPDDLPEAHFVYAGDGTIASPTERGRVTIAVFDLNREPLVTDRRAAAAQLDAEWTAFRKGSDDALGDLVRSDRPFAGLRRQLVAERLAGLSKKRQKALAASHPEALLRLYNARTVYSADERAEEAAHLRSLVADASDYSVESAPKATGYFARTVAIERVELRNVRLFKEATIEVPSAYQGQAAWLVLLGENGTGKTTLLQAVALCLAGDAYRERLGLRPDDLLRHRTKSGHVRVHLSGVPNPVTLEFERGGASFTSNAPDPKVLFLGYGATRLLPRAVDAAAVRDRAAQSTQTAYARAANLFDPLVPLADAEAWAVGLDKPTFDRVADAFYALLDLRDERAVTRRAGRLFLEGDGHRTPVRQLSAGYQSVLALAADALAVLLHMWPSAETAEGVLLIDEIGAHLHPRWQMRIVTALREVFPRLQVLATTHSPLCLRGLGDGEVSVVRRSGDDVRILTDLPPTRGLRVDQLLTSELFGLHSTVDPAVEARFERYYGLLAQYERSPEEEEELVLLRDELDGLHLLGSTRRERLALEAADQALAEHEHHGQPLDDSVRDAIRAVWEGPSASDG